MDFNQLNCFVAAARTLNFSEAARRNYVSQSTVSRYISELEKEFGVKLFIRSHRDVIITNEGKTLLQYAVEMLNSMQKAKTVISRMRDGGEGKITVGCDVTSMSFPAECISEFSEKYPAITVDLRYIDAAEKAQTITEGEFDCCFMPRDMVPESSELETLATHNEPLVIIASKKSAFKETDSIGFSDIADKKLLMLSESVSPILYMEVMDLLRVFHISPNVESSYSDINSIYVAVASGLGFSVIPRSLAGFASSKKIHTYIIDEADTGVAYVAAWARSNANPAAKLFIKTVENLATGDDNVYGL